jgi:hypothetical protein
MEENPGDAVEGVGGVVEGGAMGKACDGEGDAGQCGWSLVGEGEVLFPEAGFRIADGDALCGDDQAVWGRGVDG